MNKAILSLLLSVLLMFLIVPNPATAAPQDRSQQQGSGPGYEMLQNLEAKAKAALKAGNNRAASKYASELLKKNTDTTSWNYGNVIHSANQVLGLAALAEGKVSQARGFLLAAGKTPGSPQLNSFGPDMVLAQKLLTRGETKVVLAYLDLIAKFWAFTPEAELRAMEKRFPGSSTQSRELNEQSRKTIEEWKRQIRAGEKPQLNMSSSLR